jgi:hypothetical protein
MEKNDELYIITEVGTFGDLNITDPTKKKVKKKNKELDVLIEEAIQENKDNLINK